jgi:predicted metal-dependent peptidase
MAVELSGHGGVRAVQRMVEYAPSTGGLALWVHHRDGGDGAQLIVNDGKTLVYGPAFAKLPLPEQAGWVAHEVLHIALRHAPRYRELQGLLGDVDLQLFNTCADAIVNSTLGHLGWLALPKDAVQLDKLLLSALRQRQSVESALLEWDVERLYRAIDDRQPRRGMAAQGAKKDGEKAQTERQDGERSATVRAMGKAHATDLQPGPDSAPEEQAEEAREWAERLLRAHAGDGVFSMLRTLIADIPKSRTPWEQVLRTLLARALSPQPGISWSRPARSWLANQGRAGATRRMPWEPGRTATKAVPRLVVMVDVSGSIDDALMQRFAREIEALTRRLETTLVLVIGDDRVREVASFEPGQSSLRDIRFQGGGGTDFTPLLEEADRHAPDIGVFLTDLDGPARFKPKWPVVWAVTGGPSTLAAPFGRVLALR